MKKMQEPTDGHRDYLLNLATKKNFPHSKLLSALEFRLRREIRLIRIMELKALNGVESPNVLYTSDVDLFVKFFVFFVMKNRRVSMYLRSLIGFTKTTHLLIHLTANCLWLTLLLTLRAIRVHFIRYAIRNLLNFIARNAFTS